MKFDKLNKLVRHLESIVSSSPDKTSKMAPIKNVIVIGVSGVRNAAAFGAMVIKLLYN